MPRPEMYVSMKFALLLQEIFLIKKNVLLKVPVVRLQVNCILKRTGVYDVDQNQNIKKKYSLQFLLILFLHYQLFCHLACIFRLYAHCSRLFR